MDTVVTRAFNLNTSGVFQPNDSPSDYITYIYIYMTFHPGHPIFRVVSFNQLLTVPFEVGLPGAVRGILFGVSDRF